jgi:hypothetical protein
VRFGGPALVFIAYDFFDEKYKLHVNPSVCSEVLIY